MMPDNKIGGCTDQDTAPPSQNIDRSDDTTSDNQAQPKTKQKKRRGEHAPTVSRPCVDDDVAPSPDPVDGEALLNEIAQIIKRHVICSDAQVVAVTLWIAYTWCIDQMQVAPILNITAPEPQCGKSTLLALVGKLARRPLSTSNITPSALYRVVQAYHPTLLIDEADTFLSGNEDMRGILNSGHTRDSAYVLRCVGDSANQEPARFDTWGAKALCGIGDIPATLASRSIIIKLIKRLQTEPIKRMRCTPDNLFVMIKSKISRYCNDIASLIPQIIQDGETELPDDLDDRQQGNWESLIIIADIAGGQWPMMARAAAKIISKNDDARPSVGAVLLHDIRSVLDRFTGTKITVAYLLEKILKMDESTWTTYNRGDPLTKHQLTSKLKPYQVKPEPMHDSSTNKTARGYTIDDLLGVCSRYASADDDDGDDDDGDDIDLAGVFNFDIHPETLQNYKPYKPEKKFVMPIADIDQDVSPKPYKITNFSECESDYGNQLYDLEPLGG